MRSDPLGGILSYFGAKREMAPQIVSHFGKHDQYFEIFAGSLSVLLAKEPCRHEVVSEKNQDVANLIRCLSQEESAAELWKASSLAPVSETLFAEAAERLADPFDGDSGLAWRVMRACDFLLVSWQGPSGLAGTTRKPRFAVRNTTSGGTVAARWRAVAESIPAWHERLRNVEFRCRDAFDLAGAAPDRDGTVVYADPPYLDATRAAGRYACDFTPHDHAKLAVVLNRFRKAKVVVSYYDAEILKAYYPGWKRVELAAPRKMKHVTGGGQQQVAAPELLYINRD